MKKIPTLFKRKFEDHNIVGITPELTSPDLAWVLKGEGIATEKIDGACCAIIKNKFYKRYDAKRGKKAPEGAIPCCEPDPVTGHWPHWIRISADSPEDKWFIEAYNNAKQAYGKLRAGTYEAIGPHFQSNPYDRRTDIIVPHGKEIIYVEQTFEGIQAYLESHMIEGIVFWKDGQPRCKIKRIIRRI